MLFAEFAKTKHKRSEAQLSGADGHDDNRQVKDGAAFDVRPKRNFDKQLRRTAIGAPAATAFPADTTTTTTTTARPSQLYLDNESVPSHVFALSGSTAYLVCRLRAQMDTSHLIVSWVRSSPIEILTSGSQVHTSDTRYRALHHNVTDWTLEISPVHATNEGRYECQVNASPHPVSAAVHLYVIHAHGVSMRAEGLVGRPSANGDVSSQTMIVDEYADLRLVCRVEFVINLDMSEQASSDIFERAKEFTYELSMRHYFFWFKNNRSAFVNELRARKRANMQVERWWERRDKLRHQVLVMEAELIINDLRVEEDSAEYECKIVPEANEVANSARILVRVGSGEHSQNSGTAAKHVYPHRYHILTAMLITIFMLTTSPICYL